MPETTTGTRTQALFVTWQDQPTRRYFPVGRLTRRLEGARGVYEFCYLKGVLQARRSGFTHFVGFPDVNQVYLSHSLFPLFENRLMPRSRPDFVAYVQRLDLDPAKADDLQILARSGGRRVTDSLELFPMPDLEREGCYATFFLVHGIGYLSSDAVARVDRLLHGERLYLQLDFQNQADPNAISLRTEDRVVAGYVPRYLLPDVFKLLGGCENQPLVTAVQVNPSPAPIQHRLLCRMESCWPDGFRPYCEDDYEPISSSATKVACPE